MKRLLYALAENKARFLYVLFFGVSLNAVFTAADPVIMKLLIDDGLIRQNFRLFAVFAGLIVLFGVATRGASLVYDLFSQRLKNAMTESLTLRMVKSYFDTPYAEITNADNGYFISRLYDEPAKVAQGIVTTLIGLFVSMTTFAAGLAISLYLTWKITLIVSFIVPALYYLGKRFSQKIKESSEQENEEEARLREILGRSIECYKTVKVFELYPPVYGRVAKQLQLYLGVLYKRLKTSANYQTLSGIWLSFAEALVLIAAASGVVSGSLTIGGLFAFMSAFWKLIGAAAGVLGQFPELSRLAGYIDRLREFESLARPIENSGSNHVELDNVSFRYGSKDIFQGLSLRIEPAERVVIVGANGSGKTTLGHLITGFLNPSGGSVQTPRFERISAMLTPFHFAPGSLKDNVDYACLGEDKAALFWELVRALGLERRVEADAESELSEGEKKKCQLVMTLLKDAEVYVFDEPLANVDVGSRDKVIQTQLSYTRGKTVISIMHGDEKYHPMFDRVVALSSETCL